MNQLSFDFSQTNQRPKLSADNQRVHKFIKETDNKFNKLLKRGTLFNKKESWWVSNILTSVTNSGRVSHRQRMVVAQILSSKGRV